MKNLYSSLAWSGIRKNRRLYLPYILTCVGMIMIFYIVDFLYESPFLNNMRGSGDIKFCMSLGRSVIGVFACIFLFYTNAFLTRRRKKEFGLYNILGMGKKNISRILFHEAVLVALLSCAAGLFLGVGLSKLMELVLLHLIHAEANYQVMIVWSSVLHTLLLFGVIFLLLFLNMLRQLYFSNPIALLQSENVGEKPPRANWLFGLASLVLLGIAYYMSVSIEDPIVALVAFFAAVILVIVGTYLLFIYGSVVLCRLLQKNKRFYYHPKHFVAVSSMVYRMKRNGAGLASICIMSTMVLVMLSSTACMNIGEEESIRTRYVRDIMVNLELTDLEMMREENTEQYRQLVENAMESGGVTDVENLLTYRSACVAGAMQDGCIQTMVREIENYDSLTNIWQVFILPLEDYNRLTGAQETLGENEALLCASKKDWQGDTFTLAFGQERAQTLRIKKRIPKFVDNAVDAMQIFPSVFVVVQEYEAYLAPMMNYADFNGDRMVELGWLYGFDTQADGQLQSRTLNRIVEALEARKGQADGGILHYTGSNIAREREVFYSLYGGLFFLAMILGGVFLCATVLMIYYKQIAEGFEDQSRFEIMRKVGMTKQDIRASINVQVLLVFFLPILLAGLHLLFAFPFVEKILFLFGCTNERLLVLVTLGCFAVFALFYSLVYRITSNAYYTIVSRE